MPLNSIGSSNVKIYVPAPTWRVDEGWWGRRKRNFSQESEGGGRGRRASQRERASTREHKREVYRISQTMLPKSGRDRDRDRNRGREREREKEREK